MKEITGSTSLDALKSLLWRAPLLCDVDGDGSVDMADISLMIEWCMTSPPNWNPNCDVNGDLSIDMADISLAIENFMQT